MRPVAAALVLAAAVMAGCGHERAATPAERRACERYVARTVDRADSAYRGLVDQCVRQVLHPFAGGG